MRLFNLLFYSLSQLWYVEVRISRSFSESLGIRDNENRLNNVMSCFRTSIASRQVSQLPKVSSRKHAYRYVYRVYRGIFYFLISAQNIDCGHLLEPPRRGGSKIPTMYILSNSMENIRVFLSENFQFLEVTFSIYLNRHVFIMNTILCDLLALG